MSTLIIIAVLRVYSNMEILYVCISIIMVLQTQMRMCAAWHRHNKLPNALGSVFGQRVIGNVFFHDQLWTA